MSGENEVIDLTDSFTMSDCGLLADIIEIDDSLPIDYPRRFLPTNYLLVGNYSQIPNRRREINEAKKNKKPSTCKTSQENLLQSDRNKPFKRIGECPICWDELGNNPLASTKCGHVFCLRCIEQVLKQTPKCPTCRCVLKGRAAYHPIYLSLQS